MANRFQKLFSLMPNLYSEGCPIIIEAGALQKDTETGNIIAQIKMKNIGDIPITSCKVSLKAFENNGDEVEGVPEFSYLDLNVGRGCEFGTKVPVILPNRTARSFAVDIKEIVFFDGSVKRLDNNQWKTIPKQQPIEAVLTDAALVQQYKIEAGGDANLFPEKKDGFFLCTCGAVNYDTAKACYKCGNSYENLCKYMDRDYLMQKIDERNEKRRIEQEKKEGKKKLFIKIAVAVIAVLIVFVLINTIHKINEGKKTETANVSDAQVGSYVYFGSYEQDNNTINGSEGIEWLVLSREDDRMLIISRYALDCQYYNTDSDSEGITWETCSLRKWLNESFMYEAFTSEEQEMILSTTLPADKNPKYDDIPPGNPTEDKVSLLSIAEAEKYFSSDDTRTCQGTKYCYAQGANDDNGNCWWWLRSPGGTSAHRAADVSPDGSIDLQGTIYDFNGYGAEDDGYVAVRPALWITIDE